MNVQQISINTMPIGSTTSAETSLRWKVIDVMERVAAALSLALLSPVICLAAAAIAVLSGKPPFIAHRRVGFRGKPIWILKLRTMWDEGIRGRRATGLLERLTGEEIPVSKPERDPRVTSAFGRACRKFSIDELPQLLQVVRGELALIGPRPLTSTELAAYYAPHQNEVLARKPGLSGLWQVRGRNRLNYGQRLTLDLFLVRHWSFGLYWRIFVITVPRIVLGRDAW